MRLTINVDPLIEGSAPMERSLDFDIDEFQTSVPFENPLRDNGRFLRRRRATRF